MEKYNYVASVLIIGGCVYAFGVPGIILAIGLIVIFKNIVGGKNG